MTFAELVAFAGRHPLLSLALAGITQARVYNEIAGRHDLWVMIAGVFAPPLAAWLAQKLPRWGRRITA